MPAERVRLAGRAALTLPVVVAARRIPAGRAITAADLRVERWRAERVRPGTAAALEEVVGRQLRRPLGEGQAVAAGRSGPGSGDRAQRDRHRRGGGRLPAAQRCAGRALADAAVGEAVPVMNPASRAVIEAVAIGPGRARAVFGAAPLPPVPETMSPTAAIAARLANR